MSNTIWDKPTTKRSHDNNRKLSPAGMIDLEKRPICANCGEVLGVWVSIGDEKWDGHPVLYIGREKKLPHYAIQFQFCDGECLTEWCADNSGYRLADHVYRVMMDEDDDLYEELMEKVTQE
jgi:hypothetical protein